MENIRATKGKHVKHCDDMDFMELHLYALCIHQTQITSLYTSQARIAKKKAIEEYDKLIK